MRIQCEAMPVNQAVARPIKAKNSRATRKALAPRGSGGLFFGWGANPESRSCPDAQRLPTNRSRDSRTFTRFSGIEIRIQTKAKLKLKFSRVKTTNDEMRDGPL